MKRKILELKRKRFINHYKIFQAGSPNPTVTLRVHHFTKQRGPVEVEVLPPREVETW